MSIPRPETVDMLDAKNVNNSSSNHQLSAPDLLVHFDHDEYAGLLFTVTFLLASTLLVIAFKETPVVVKLERRAVPESLLLILAGLAFGAATHSANFRAVELDKLEGRKLLDVLVPPIILSCSYDLYRRRLVPSSDGIFLFGIASTTFSILATGYNIKAI